MKTDKQELIKKREYSKRYREKHLDKDKKFFSVRVSKEEGEEIKAFIKEYNMPIKKIIELGVEDMWEEINEKAS